jgi:outer membrane protein assembly factor BamE (lipoprotein component of BamABCDE complex)
MKKISIAVALLATLSLQACKSVDEHRAAVRNDSADKITVGKVQAEVRVGMSGGDVVGVLGSPNIVTTDEQRREVWVYDKFATESAYSTSSGGVSVLVLAGIGNVLGGVAPSVSNSTGASSKTQRTLTIVIKFDEAKKVRDFAYHSSSF